MSTTYEPNVTIDPCPVCGTPIVQRGGRGRPKEFCSADCRQIKYALCTLLEQVDGLVERCQPESASQIKGELWRLGNLFNRVAGGRQRKSRA